MLGRPQRSRATRLDAHFDPKDARLRYRLEREFHTGDGVVHFIMLNGSAANAHHNDATVSKCERYALEWEYRTLLVSNLFAYMARDPHELMTVQDPVGAQNDAALLRAVHEAELTVCAWGDYGLYKGRAHYVTRQLLRDVSLYALRLNRSGQPAHPIYLPQRLTPQLWQPHDSHK